MHTINVAVKLPPTTNTHIYTLHSSQLVGAAHSNVLPCSDDVTTLSDRVVKREGVSHRIERYEGLRKGSPEWWAEGCIELCLELSYKQFLLILQFSLRIKEVPLNTYMYANV